MTFMSPRWRIVAFGALSVMTALVSGCVAPIVPPTQPTSPQATRSDGSPAPSAGLAFRDPTGTRMFANVGGKLVFRGGCLLLDGTTIPVFERGTASFDGMTLVYLGDSYTLGESVDWGGGRPDEPIDLNALGLPQTCPGTDLALINGPG